MDLETTVITHMMEVRAGIDLTPPKAVRDAAKRGLKYRKEAPKSQKGGLTPEQAAKMGIGSGVARAKQLSSGKKVSPADIKRMVAFFSRHQKNYDKGGVRAQIAWLLWGGNPGKAWAKNMLTQIKKVEEADKKAKKRKQ